MTRPCPRCGGPQFGFCADDTCNGLAKGRAKMDALETALAAERARGERLREALDRAATAAEAWCGYNFDRLGEPGRAAFAANCLSDIAKEIRAALSDTGEKR